MAGYRLRAANVGTLPHSGRGGPGAGRLQPRWTLLNPDISSFTRCGASIHSHVTQRYPLTLIHKRAVRTPLAAEANLQDTVRSNIFFYGPQNTQ